MAAPDKGHKLKYSEEEFFRLVPVIVKQGGTYLDEIHENVYHTSFTGGKVTAGVSPRGQINYCNAKAMFTVPYIDHPEDEPVKVCAIDDCVGLWPRFAEAKAPGSDHNYLPGSPSE